jgi:membrane associated rhomboid family serine protease
MSESGVNPAEAILRMCADAAPEPWYPRLYAKQTGQDLDALAFYLEELWLDGLIQKTAGTKETGPGISLTTAGERVLNDPEQLQRLRAGQPLVPGDRGSLIRQALRVRVRPYVTLVLVLLNVVVFAVGYHFAREKQVGKDFLRGNVEVNGPPTADAVRKQKILLHLQQESGAISAYTWIDGQWWRLLTAGFVHIGFLHLLMNMACLYFAGRFIEQMWGHFRYLVIYLVALLGGSCLAVAHHVGLSAGASGAICGLLGAEAVWFFFNRRYLPRNLLRQARTNVILNVILLVFIGSFENVSNWGHFGGAAAGAMAALLLHLQRFGPAGWRWLALAGFVPMAWYGHYAIDHARATNPAWLEVEDKQFVDRYYRSIRDAMNKAGSVYKNEVIPLMEQDSTRRDPTRVESVLKVMAEQQGELNALAERLERMGPYRSPDAEEARQKSREYLLAGSDLFAAAEHVLQLAGKPPWQDVRALHEQEKRVNELQDDWRDRFQR